MRKLGWVLIGIIFTAMLWTILALWNPAIGTGTRYIFIDIVGANIVNGATGASNTVMLWGATGFPQAMAVFLGTGITFILVGIGFSRLIWPKMPFVHKKEVVVVKPLQSQLTTPDLYSTPPPKPQEQTVKVEEKT